MDGNPTVQDVTLSANPQSGTNSYTYDNAGRLASWTHDGGTATGYTWDGAGNRLTAGTDVYTYDARNQILSGPEGDFTYTARGTTSTVSDGTTTVAYTFDAFGRLTDYNGQAAYTYDGLDRVATRQGTAFSYAGFSLDPISDGTFTYAHSPGGRVLAIDDGTDAFLAGTNRHGDLTHLFDTAGAIADSTLYDPFGDVTGTSGTVNPTIGYQSDYTDPASDHVWMGARWYDGGRAAFPSRDTVFGELSTPISLNRYTYPGANPLMFWDPDGRLRNCVSIEGFACADAVIADSSKTSIAGFELTGEQHFLRQKVLGQIAEQTAAGALDKVDASSADKASELGACPPVCGESLYVEEMGWLTGYSCDNPGTNRWICTSTWSTGVVRVDSKLHTYWTNIPVGDDGQPVRSFIPDGTFVRPQATLQDDGSVIDAWSAYRTSDEAQGSLSEISGLILGEAFLGGIVNAAFKTIRLGSLFRRGAGAVDEGVDMATDLANYGSEFLDDAIRSSVVRPDLSGLSPKIVRQMQERGWTSRMIDDAVQAGDGFPAVNKLDGVNTPATRYVHPGTGQSVVVDNITGEVIHVGLPGYLYP